MKRIWIVIALLACTPLLYNPVEHVHANAKAPRIVASVVLTNPTGSGSSTALFTAAVTGPHRLTVISVVSGASPGGTGCGGGIDYSFTDDFGTVQTNQVGDTPTSEVGVTRVISAKSGTTVSYQLFNFNGCATSNLYITAEEL